MRITVDNFLNSAVSLASPGMNELRWLKPVRPGDTLARAVHDSGSPALPNASPTAALVRTGIEVLNQADEVVMTMTALNLIRSRPS